LEREERRETERESERELVGLKEEAAHHTLQSRGVTCKSVESPKLHLPFDRALCIGCFEVPFAAEATCMRVESPKLHLE